MVHTESGKAIQWLDDRVQEIIDNNDHSFHLADLGVESTEPPCLTLGVDGVDINMRILDYENKVIVAHPVYSLFSVRDFLSVLSLNNPELSIVDRNFNFLYGSPALTTYIKEMRYKDVSYEYEVEIERFIPCKGEKKNFSQTQVPELAIQEGLLTVYESKNDSLRVEASERGVVLKNALEVINHLDEQILQNAIMEGIMIRVKTFFDAKKIKFNSREGYRLEIDGIMELLLKVRVAGEFELFWFTEENIMIDSWEIKCPAFKHLHGVDQQIKEKYRDMSKSDRNFFRYKTRVLKM